MSFDGGHERVFRSSPVIATGLDSCLDAAQAWLRRAYLRLSPGVGGWAMSDVRRDLTVWGGTVDGIRALAALGYRPRRGIFATASTGSESNSFGPEDFVHVR
jgi:hypothetical protein